MSFTYDGSDVPALSHLSFTVEPGGRPWRWSGPSGGGKTTAASLIPRFWDATSGTVEVGGVDVKADRSPCADGSGGFRLSEQPAV